MTRISRRNFVATSTFLAATAAFGRGALGQIVAPTKPLNLNVVDTAGDLALTQKIFENYARAKPSYVGRFSFSKALQPDMPGKIRAQQDAKQVDIDLVLCGYDGLTAGIEQKIWLELLPAHQKVLPNPDEIYLPGALKIQQQTMGQGMVMAYSPYGSLLEYMPDRVKTVPRTADEFLAWCRQNKNRFIYARPANSGPGRAFITGLPFLLGDSDPTDPVNGWTKTWSYLKAVGENVEYYPAATGAALKEFAEGSRDMMPTTTGWDINPRALGVVPKEAKIAALEGFHWVSDAHCVAIPRGVAEEKIPVLLDLISFMLTPPQQANIYDSGYFYPGPSIKNAPLSMAPEESRNLIAEYGRPEYEGLIASHPQEPPLTPSATAAAFRIWDQQIGAARHN